MFRFWPLTCLLAAGLYTLSKFSHKNRKARVGHGLMRINETNLDDKEWWNVIKTEHFWENVLTAVAKDLQHSAWLNSWCEWPANCTTTLSNESCTSDFTTQKVKWCCLRKQIIISRREMTYTDTVSDLVLWTQYNAALLLGCEIVEIRLNIYVLAT